MRNKHILTAGILCLFSVATFAQLAMGKWRTHFAYNNATQVAQSESKIYAVSDGALFSIDKQDYDFEYYSKITGLNSTNISRIKFDSATKQLLIIYADGNIDVLSSGGVTNIPDFFNKQMSATKTVKHIYLYQEKAYLSTDFGIIALNIKKREIADTYYIGSNGAEVKVLSTTVNNGIIYAATATGLYKASITEPNLVNFEFWSFTDILPGSGEIKSIGSFAGQLILLRGGKLYKKDSGNTWEAILPDQVVTEFNTFSDIMTAYVDNNVYTIDTTFNTSIMNGIGTINDADYDALNKKFWFAANELGVISCTQPSTVETPILNYYKPAGPIVNVPWNLTFAGEKLFVVPGGRMSAQYGRMGNIMIYENDSWTNIPSTDIQEFPTLKAIGKKPLDFVNVAVDPTNDDHFFVTSWGTGLYEFKDNKMFQWHNTTNSGLEGHPLVPNDPNNYTRIDGATFDKAGNLFLTNSAVASNVKVLLADNQWVGLKYPNSTFETLGSIHINSKYPNQKWFPSVRGGDIIIFDDKGTIKDQTDDVSTTLTSFNYYETENGQPVLQKVYPEYSYTIVEDKNGVIWVGTSEGPFLFQNTSKVFDADYTCSRVKIPRNDGSGNADYLLNKEEVKAIAIDGANRKWLGTSESGVYLMSENGQETIQHFTTANSPLLSNDIFSIAINPVTGEVFFATGMGVISYQSDAAEAGTEFTNVHAYPNPVREGYTGIITITGLIDNTEVKITDLNGNLICQTVSNGSVATWDGKDTYGRKVSTGIYLAICASADGTKSAITKILFIN